MKGSKINTKLLRQMVIGMDFLSAVALKQKQPSVDSFLDYRSVLLRAVKNKRTPTKCWLNREINAVDEILKIINQ